MFFWREIIGIIFALLVFSAVCYSIFIFISFISRKIRGASTSNDKVNWLKKEIPVWIQNNTISNQQGDNLLEYYLIQPKKEFKKTNLARLLTTIGSILLGLGVILFVAANWTKLSKIFEIILILSVTFITFILGYYFSYKKNGYNNLGKGLLFASSIMWGGAIAFLSQMYHIPGSDIWIIFLLWAIPILPVGYFFDSSPTFILSSILALVWNLSYNIGINASNYYYLAFAFIILLPLSRKNKLHYIINIIAILISSFFGFIFKLNFFNLLIPICFLLYYLIIDRKEIFLISASISSIFWIAAYNNAYQSPNYLFIPLFIILLYFTYTKKSIVQLVLNIIAFLLWFSLFSYYFFNLINTNQLSSKIQYDTLISIIIILNLIIGVILYLVGYIKNNRPDYAKFGDIYKAFGYGVIIASTYVLSFKGLLQNDFFMKIQNFVLLKNNLTPQLFILFIFAIAVFLFIYNLFNKKLSIKPDLFQFILLFMLLFQVVNLLINSNLTFLHIVIMNVFLVIFSIFSIIFGFNNRNSKIFYTGIAIFILFLITRYFDYFWGLLDRSVFFIIGGILLIIGSIFLERERKSISKRVTNDE